MNRTLAAWLVAMSMLLPAIAMAQQTGGSPAPSANQQQAAPPANPKPKSKQELQALQALNALCENPATTGDQVDAAVTDFTTKYPKSDFLSIVNVWAMTYFQSHQNYVKVLEYGEAAIKYNPDELFALTTVAADIPTQVHDTDLDKDQRLAEAESDDNQALALLAAPTVVYNGHTLTPDQINEFKSRCYESLGRVALDRKQYQTAVENYQKALTIATPATQAMDYYLLAQAQEGLQKYSDANASLDQVIAGNNPQLAQMAKAEKAKIAPMVGH